MKACVDPPALNCLGRIRFLTRARAALAIAALLLLALAAAGCGNPGDPDLPVARVRTWMLPPDGASLPAPRAVTADPATSRLLVLDTAGRVLLYNPDGTLIRAWRMPETSAGRPEGACFLEGGRIAVADTHYHRVLLFDDQGTVLASFGRQGREPGAFLYPVGVATDPAGSLYVCEYGGNDRVQKFSPDGRFLLTFGRIGTEPDAFQRPSGLVWHDGRVYVADAINNRIQVFSDQGHFVKTLGDPESELGLRLPYDVALQPARTRGDSPALLAVEYAAGRVTALDLEGRLLGRYGSPGTAQGRFRTPWGLTAGPGSTIFVADTGNRRMVALER